MGFLILLILLILTSLIGYMILEKDEKMLELKYVPVYTVVGIVLISIISFFLGVFKLPLIMSALIIFLGTVIIFKKRFKIVLGSIPINLILIGFLGVFGLSSHAFFEGFKDGELVFLKENSHDALWHIALQESIKKSIPPENPIFSGSNLSGYHYFTDIYLAQISLLSGLDTSLLYINFFPIFLALLFSTTLYLLFLEFTKNEKTSFLTTLLAIFGSGFAYMAPLLFRNATFSQSVFWLDQPVRLLINQQLVLSLCVVNVILFLFLKSIKKYWILVGVLLGSLVGIKVYGLVVMLLGLGAVALLRIKHEREAFKAIVLSLIIAAIALFFAGAGQKSPFIIEPGWFVRSMFASGDRLNYSEWEIHRQLFENTGNYLRLFLHWIYGIAVFLFGNYGVKLLGLLLPLLFFWTKTGKDRNRTNLIFLIVISLSAMFLPLILLQQGIVWNSIQFMHYATIPLILLILFFLNRFSSKNQILILSLLLLISLPTTIMTLNQNFQSSNYERVGADIIGDLKNIENSIQDNGQIIVGSEFNKTSIIPALLKRPVFYADPTILEILNIETAERKNLILQIEENKIECSKNQIFILQNYTNEANTNYDKIYSGRVASLYKCKS